MTSQQLTGTALLSSPQENPQERLETAWRSIKKPLLSISSKKGVTPKTVNNFNTLLADHKLIKVKFGGLREDDAGDKNGAMDELVAKLVGDGGVEVIRKQMRDGVVMFGVEGMTSKVESGEHLVKKKKKWLRKPLIPGGGKKKGGADSVDVDWDDSE